LEFEWVEGEKLNAGIPRVRVWVGWGWKVKRWNLPR